MLALKAIELFQVPKKVLWVPMMVSGMLYYLFVDLRKCYGRFRRDINPHATPHAMIESKMLAVLKNCFGGARFFVPLGLAERNSISHNYLNRFLVTDPEAEIATARCPRKKLLRSGGIMDFSPAGDC